MPDPLFETLLQKASSIGPTEGGLPGYPPPLQEQGMPLPSFGAGKLVKPVAKIAETGVDYFDDLVKEIIRLGTLKGAGIMKDWSVNTIENETGLKVPGPGDIIPWVKSKIASDPPMK